MEYKRSELREKAMIILYQIEIRENNKIEYNVDDIIKENLSVDNEFVKNLVYGVITYKKELDEIANKYLENWTIKRLEKTGASILRMALFELKYMDTPEIVVINEAKKYDAEDLKSIITAVLDKYIKD